MKRAFLLLITTGLVLTSCSKKTIPAATTKQQPRAIEKTYIVPKTDTPVKTEVLPETPVAETPAPAPAVFNTPMIVIDEAGRVVTPRDKLPEDIADKVDYKSISHAFTPVQRQNLITRFKMIPPKVLFVPAQLALKSAKGSYCIFKKKFWYWKKDDGLFYLDETYYQ